MDIDLPPKDWTSSYRPARSRPRYTLKVIFLAVAVSALYNFRAVTHAVASLYAGGHSTVPPGAYIWTPEHGLQPAPHR